MPDVGETEVPRLRDTLLEMSSGQSDRRDALPHGTLLRDYAVHEVLGHGGFGIVYKALHRELGHFVAIKEYLPSELALREGTVVRPRSSDSAAAFDDGLRRFHDEARALIAFQDHPNVVACRDFFRGNGTAYFVMEYVDGLPLSQVLRNREAEGRPITEEDLLAIAVPLAEGLAHVHEAGVLHRDVKPANILIRRADDRPVLIDFGAAKQTVAGRTRSFAPYTEGYAALEQVAEGRLGPWTDVYGFGAVLWRMVAGGIPPWEPPNPVKVERRANAQLRGESDPLPSAAKLGEGRFSRDLLEMIDRCLQLQDSERLADSGQVLRLLQLVREGSSLPHRRAERNGSTGFLGTAWSRVRGRKRLLIAVALVLAVFALLRWTAPTGGMDDREEALRRWDDNGNGRITCAEARRHGIAPVHRGHPAYPLMYDRDRDGVVCE